MKDKILYIGEFPPPYGGVTIKNSLLVGEILADCDLETFDLYRFVREKPKALSAAIELIRAIRHAQSICVGVGHPHRMCLIFRMARFLRGKAFLGNITVFMMGSGTPGYLREHPRYIPDVALGRCIFTESEQLNAQLFELGCDNARYLPNFRKSSGACEPRPTDDVVRFVYFAQVRPEKGFDTLAAAAQKLNAEGLRDSFDISVYGSVVDGYQSEFEHLLAQIPNMKYKGAFDAAKHDVYAELNQYDASASSSSWREGMSGSNIECKFAGVANIVSEAGFNSECVSNGVDGLLVKPRDVNALADAMQTLISDHDLLQRMKWASYRSHIHYDVATWKQRVLYVIG